MLPFATTDPATEQELFTLASRERLARDIGDWDQLQSCYWPDSVVRVTWFTGTAAEFVAMSRERAKGGSGMHVIDPARTEVVGDRALIESRGQILIRPRLHEVACDVTSWCRFFSRAERRGGQWRLVSFDSLYVKDRIDAIDPSADLTLDPSALESYRSSYRHLTYLNKQAGYSVPDDLPGVDRPELIESFYSDARAWLHEN